MKIYAAIAALILAGCGTMTPMEELERQALLTGDWSAVQKRQRMIELRERRLGKDCPAGHISYCIEDRHLSSCHCITREAFQASLN